MRSAVSLDDIGFYTLSEERARTASPRAMLHRCELILTDRCNFRCTYCRGLKYEYQQDLTYEKAKRTLNYWLRDGVRNVRFSGGEPTLWPALEELVMLADLHKVEHIALSTNGSLPTEKYQRLLERGVNDFSISLDACCAATADTMAGGKSNFDRVVQNIEYLSKRTYVTVGVVVTEENLKELPKTIEFASNLGVADIRIITAAQFNSKEALEVLGDVPVSVLQKHPILRHRLYVLGSGRNIRGLREGDSHHCPLVLDDMAVVGDHHYPCIIYLREQGKPIGTVGPNMRKEREQWFRTTDTHADPICKKNCLDFCVDYNNACFEYGVRP